MQTYQALLKRHESITHVQMKRPEIERIGGKVEVAPPLATGIIIVTLWLPSQYQPQQFFPDLPFYPV